MSELPKSQKVQMAFSQKLLMEIFEFLLILIIENPNIDDLPSFRAVNIFATEAGLGAV